MDVKPFPLVASPSCLSTAAGESAEEVEQDVRVLGIKEDDVVGVT